MQFLWPIAIPVANRLAFPGGHCGGGEGRNQAFRGLLAAKVACGESTPPQHQRVLLYNSNLHAPAQESLCMHLYRGTGGGDDFGQG